MVTGADKVDADVDDDEHDHRQATSGISLWLQRRGDDLNHRLNSYVDSKISESTQKVV